MKQHAKQVLVITVAICFLVLGVIGLVLPVLQGVLFLIIGLLLLSVYSPKIRRFINSLVVKYPRLQEIVKKADKIIEHVVGRP